MLLKYNGPFSVLIHTTYHQNEHNYLKYFLLWFPGYDTLLIFFLPTFLAIPPHLFAHSSPSHLDVNVGMPSSWSLSSIYTYFFADLNQSHGLWYHLYMDESCKLTFSPSLSLKS